MTGVVNRRGEVSQRHGEGVQVETGRSCSGAATSQRLQGLPGAFTSEEEARASDL